MHRRLSDVDSLWLTNRLAFCSTIVSFLTKVHPLFKPYPEYKADKVVSAIAKLKKMPIKAPMLSKARSNIEEFVKDSEKIFKKLLGLLNLNEKENALVREWVVVLGKMRMLLKHADSKSKDGLTLNVELTEHMDGLFEKIKKEIHLADYSAAIPPEMWEFIFLQPEIDDLSIRSLEDTNRTFRALVTSERFFKAQCEQLPPAQRLIKIIEKLDRSNKIAFLLKLLNVQMILLCRELNNDFIDAFADTQEGCAAIIKRVNFYTERCVTPYSNFLLAQNEEIKKRCVNELRENRLACFEMLGAFWTEYAEKIGLGSDFYTHSICPIMNTLLQAHLSGEDEFELLKQCVEQTVDAINQQNMKQGKTAVSESAKENMLKMLSLANTKKIHISRALWQETRSHLEYRSRGYIP